MIMLIEYQLDVEWVFQAFIIRIFYPNQIVDVNQIRSNDRDLRDLKLWKCEIYRSRWKRNGIQLVK